MVRKIVEGKAIQYENVVSAHFKIRPDEFEQTFTLFFETLAELGIKQLREFFYSIYPDLQKEGQLQVEVFAPVHSFEDVALPEQYSCHSYFQVLNLVSTYAQGDSESEITRANLELMGYLKKYRLKERTPVFHRVFLDNKVVYTEIMVGII